MNGMAVGSVAVPPIGGTRLQAVVELLGDDTGSVLDVGCRDRGLKDLLPDGGEYVGMDLGPPADVICSAEEPYPFPEDAFDAVVTADVLEHLENPHGALTEAIRVARRVVIVSLPNVYTLRMRMLYLAGRTFGKYEFGPERPQDRHRWLMNYEQAAAFTDGVARTTGWRVTREHGHIPFRRPTVRWAHHAMRAARSSPNVWAWGYIARLEPPQNGGPS